MSKTVIKLNGFELEFFDNIILSTQLNAISSSFSFDTFLDISDYEYSKIEVFRDSILIFTGVVIEKSEPNSITPKPYNYKCYSLTGILEDCSIPLDKYPIQNLGKSTKEIIEEICSYFDISVKFDSSATEAINQTYEIQDQSPESRVNEILNNLCSQKNLILTHNSKGELLITKTIIGNLEILPEFTNAQKSLRYRSFYNKYSVIGQQQTNTDTELEATATQPNIDSKRTITKIQTDGSSEISENQAESLKNASYKNNGFTIEFNDFFANVGSYYKIDNIEMVCNSINYTQNSNSEKCSCEFLNKKVYL